MFAPLQDRINRLIVKIMSHNNITTIEAEEILWATLGHFEPKIIAISESACIDLEPKIISVSEPARTEPPKGLKHGTKRT